MSRQPGQTHEVTAECGPVGLPTGTTVGADSPLYGWFDQGGGGQYSVQDGSQPTTGGHGYWAFFSCVRVVTVAGLGSAAADFALAACHASMIGNPAGTGAAASISGYDYAAAWDPTLDNGAGGYRVSGYRQAQSLAVGQGTAASASPLVC